MQEELGRSRAKENHTWYSFSYNWKLIFAVFISVALITAAIFLVPGLPGLSGLLSVLSGQVIFSALVGVFTLLKLADFYEIMKKISGAKPDEWMSGIYWGVFLLAGAAIITFAVFTMGSVFSVFSPMTLLTSLSVLLGIGMIAPFIDMWIIYKKDRDFTEAADVKVARQHAKKGQSRRNSDARIGDANLEFSLNGSEDERASAAAAVSAEPAAAGQQKQREEKHSIRAPAARPDPVTTEKDLQLEGILEALDNALKGYTPTTNVWSFNATATANAKLEAVRVLIQAIKGNIKALEQRLTSDNKAGFMALITKGKLGTTITTQLATISPPINASDSKSQKPISIDDLIEFLQRNYRNNSERHENFEIDTSLSKLKGDTGTLFGNKDLLGSMTDFLSPKDQASLAQASQGLAGMFRRSPHTGERFLLYVAQGEQDKAEAMLRSKPALASYSGTVTDLSERRFTNITAFQYALWAMDWHMWTMLLKYLSKPEAAAQARALEEDGTEYGNHFDLNELPQALDTYIKHYNSWDNSMRTKHWCKVVGRAQRQLPAHVVNEYCRLDRSFRHTPTFTETSLPRTRAIYVNKPDDEWFSVVYSGGRIGDSFAVASSCYGPWIPESPGASEGYAHGEHRILQSLSSVRTQQLDALLSGLDLDLPAEAKQDMRCLIS